MLEVRRGCATTETWQTLVPAVQAPLPYGGQTMALPLSPELQHALYATHNVLEVVDPSTNPCSVIVAKDRWVERTAEDRNWVGARFRVSIPAPSGLDSAQIGELHG